MAEYLIQGETLTATADRIRDYTCQVGDDTHVINFDYIQAPTSNDGQPGILYTNEIQIYYYEDVDNESQSSAEPYLNGDLYHGGVEAYAYLPNNNGDIVPVIYLVNGVGEYKEPYFYQGIEVIQNIAYDKWRKIETTDSYGNEPDKGNYTWDSDHKSYIYTTRIVVSADEMNDLISPTEFPSKITDVYNQGVADGGTVKLPPNSIGSDAQKEIDAQAAKIQEIRDLVASKTSSGNDSTDSIYVYDTLHLDIVYNGDSQNAKLNWNKVNEADTYSVYTYDTLAGGYRLKKSGIKGTSYTVTPGTVLGEYYEVRAYNGSTVIATSNQIEVKIFYLNNSAAVGNFSWSLSSDKTYLTLNLTNKPAEADCYYEKQGVDEHFLYKIPAALTNYTIEAPRDPSSMSVYYYKPGYIRSERACWQAYGTIDDESFKIVY